MDLCMAETTHLFYLLSILKVIYLAVWVLSCIMQDRSLQRTGSLTVAGGLQSTLAQ